jgi:hypothetical protein
MPCYSTAFQGIVHWPHLDFGRMGVEKQLVSVDVTATAAEGVSVSIGYDQRNVNSRTDDYLIDGDTLPAQGVPIPVAGPSFDLRLTFEPGQAWELDAANLWIQDMRAGR